MHLHLGCFVAIIHAMKQHIEEALHNSSISLASIVRELHSSNDTHERTLEYAMEAYKNTRRAMDKNHEGKTYKSREAYDAITNGVFPNAAPSYPSWN